MKEDLRYPTILQELFPGHPARHLQCKNVYTNESGQAKKHVITVSRGAQLEDYLRHLSIGSKNGFFREFDELKSSPL